jgi:hypothetical protein
VRRPIERAWDVQQQWSAAANDAHQRVDRFRRWNLMALVGAALAGALGGLFNDQSAVVRTMAIVGAALLGFGAFIQQRFLSNSDIGSWLSARDASERLKSDVWRSLGLGTTDDPDVAAGLLASIEHLQTDGLSLAAAIVEPSADTKPMPAVSSIGDYRRLRAGGQATWHNGRVATLHAKAKRLRHAELGITLVGLVVSATAAGVADLVLTPMVSALTTVAAVIAAHLSASKYERIAAGYALTAVRLETLLVTTADTATSTNSTAADIEFVDAVERVLAEQNTAWISLFSED